MGIKIKEVKNKKDLKVFIYLPEKIHAHHKEWLPPMYEDEWKFFSKDKNASFAHCSSILLLAYDGTKPVGRVMGVVPHEYNKRKGVQSARFSFFECYEEPRIFKALISAIEAWARVHKCEEVVGPMSFSDKEPQGFLTKGFDEPTMMVTNCNLPFMSAFVQRELYEPYVSLYEYEVPIRQDIVERYIPYAQRVERYNTIEVHEFTSTREVKKYIKPIFDLINKTYRNIYGFSPLTDVEVQEFSSRYLPFLDARLIKIITNEQGEVIAFIIAMADISEGIRKARGRLFPWGWFHLLRALRTSKSRLVLLLGGVTEDMRNKGLDAVLGIRLLSTASQLGFRTMDSHIIMKDNYKMRREIERLEGHRRYKEYMIYRKGL